MKFVIIIKISFNEIYSHVGTSKRLSNAFPIQNGLKQGDDLSPIRFNFALQYAIMNFQERKKEKKGI
jgi:hypothetical protein